MLMMIYSKIQVHGDSDSVYINIIMINNQIIDQSIQVSILVDI